jgi:hypothetical protein
MKVPLKIVFSIIFSLNFLQFPSFGGARGGFQTSFFPNMTAPIMAEINNTEDISKGNKNS